MAKIFSLKETIARYRKPEDHLFAVVDAARDQMMYMHGRYNLNLEFTTLLKGSRAPYTMHVAPLLVQLDDDRGFLDLWADRLGNSSGILIIAPESLESLLKHLRMIFHVQDEDGNKFLFRFFDPRVFRPALETLTPEQSSEFFGPVRWFFVEDDTKNTVRVYSRDPKKTCFMQKIPVAPRTIAPHGDHASHHHA